MKKAGILLTTITLFFLTTAFAGNNITSDVKSDIKYTKTKVYYVDKNKPAVNAVRDKSFSSSATRGPSVLMLYQGSLKNNITRLSHIYGWNNVVWDLSDDYRWVGTTGIVADSLQDALRKVLRDYPLQAVFYLGNRVLLIRPRTLQ